MRARATYLATLSVLAVGLFLTIPSACVLMKDPPDADADVAVDTVIRLPLEGLNKSRSAQAAFDVPLRWQRMQAEWGDAVYAVRIVLPRGSGKVTFEKLGIHAQASVNGRQLALESPTYTPYAYWIQDGAEGFIFKPNPGDRVVLDVSISEGVQLPPGELDVAGYSNAYTKDRVVGWLLDEDFRRWSKRALPVGLILLAAGALGVFVVGRR